MGYTIWLFNIAMVKPWPIEIDGLPIKHGDFPWPIEIDDFPFMWGITFLFFWGMTIYIDTYIWVNFTTTSLFSRALGMVVSRGHYPQMTLFQVSELI